jgi:hypothetical protein
MTNIEYEALVEGLPEILRSVLAEGRKGPFTAPSLQAPLGRNNGLTTELRRLQGLGLIREIGKRRTGAPGIQPREYEIVPPGGVEQASAA